MTGVTTKNFYKQSTHKGDFISPWEPLTTTVTGYKFPLSEEMCLYAECVEVLDESEEWVGYVQPIGSDHLVWRVSVCITLTENVAKKIAKEAVTGLSDSAHKLLSGANDISYYLNDVVRRD